MTFRHTSSAAPLRRAFIDDLLRRALHLAARDGMVTATETLLSKGASVFAVDHKGRYPALSCAGNEKIADCLELIISQMMQVGGSTPRPSLANTRTSVESLGNNIGETLCSYVRYLKTLRSIFA